MNPLDQVKTALMQIGDINNEQAPIFGPIRKFNRETFGIPGYANPKLSKREQTLDLAMRMVAPHSIKALPAGLQGIRIPKYGMPKADVADLEHALDLVRSRRTSKMGQNIIQDIIESYAPGYKNIHNRNVVDVAQSLLDTHYGSGEVTPVANIKKYLK